MYSILSLLASAANFHCLVNFTNPKEVYYCFIYSFIVSNVRPDCFVRHLFFLTNNIAVLIQNGHQCHLTSFALAGPCLLGHSFASSAPEHTEVLECTYQRCPMNFPFCAFRSSFVLPYLSIFSSNTSVYSKFPFLWRIHVHCMSLILSIKNI